MFRPVEELNELIRDHCRQHEILVTDAYLALLDQEGNLAEEFDSGDGVHLNGMGYETLGRFVASDISDVMAHGSIVACLGDSLTEGYPGHFIGAEGEARWKPYPFYLERPGVTVLNLGRCGDTTDGLMRRFHSEVEKRSPKPSICIVQGGVNDLFMDVKADSIAKNLIEVYDTCSRHGMTPIAMTILPVRIGIRT